MPFGTLFISCINYEIYKAPKGMNLCIVELLFDDG
jgi:hypothetical protein